MARTSRRSSSCPQQRPSTACGRATTASQRAGPLSTPTQPNKRSGTPQHKTFGGNKISIVVWGGCWRVVRGQGNSLRSMGRLLGVRRVSVPRHLERPGGSSSAHLLELLQPLLGARDGAAAVGALQHGGALFREAVLGRRGVAELLLLGAGVPKVAVEDVPELLA